MTGRAADDDGADAGAGDRGEGPSSRDDREVEARRRHRLESQAGRARLSRKRRADGVVVLSVPLPKDLLDDLGISPTDRQAAGRAIERALVALWEARILERLAPALASRVTHADDGCK